MKTYIYGENFLATRKNLYLVKTYNVYGSENARFDVYIQVNGYSDEKGKTNSFTSCDGNSHITGIKNEENLPLFNEVKKNNKLYNAILKRFSIFKQG